MSEKALVAACIWILFLTAFGLLMTSTDTFAVLREAAEDVYSELRHGSWKEKLRAGLLILLAFVVLTVLVLLTACYLNIE